MIITPFLQVARTALLASSNSAADSMIETPKTPLASLLPPSLVTDTCRARVYLLRHGETDWNAKGLMQGGGFDIELNDKGRQQAVAVGENALAGLPITVIASSHLQRASQTADILLHQQFPTAQRVVLPEFAEMSFGSFEGLAIRGPDATEETLGKFKAFQTKMKKDAKERWPGGESTQEVELRAQRGLNQLLEEFGGPEDEPLHIAIVAHGRTNKVLLASLLTGDVLQYDGFQQGNTCINVIDLDSNGVWMSQTINYVDHIEGTNLARQG